MLVRTPTYVRTILILSFTGSERPLPYLYTLSDPVSLNMNTWTILRERERQRVTLNWELSKTLVSFTDLEWLRGFSGRYWGWTPRDIDGMRSRTFTTQETGCQIKVLLEEWAGNFKKHFNRWCSKITNVGFYDWLSSLLVRKRVWEYYEMDL